MPNRKEHGKNREKNKWNIREIIAVLCTLVLFFQMAQPAVLGATEAYYDKVGELVESVEATESEAVTEAVPEAYKILYEETEMREESVKYFRRADGAIVAAMYSEPIHYEEDGVYLDIDNTLAAVKTESGVSVFRNKANILGVELPSVLNQSPVKVTRGEHYLSWEMRGQVNDSVASVSEGLSKAKVKAELAAKIEKAVTEKEKKE